MIFLVLSQVIGESYHNRRFFQRTRIGWFDLFPELLDFNVTSGENMMSNFDGAICFFKTAGTHSGWERFFLNKKDLEKFVDNEPGAEKTDFQLLVVLEHHILDDWRS